MPASQNIWFIGFDAKPKIFSKNYAFIYIMRAFLNKKVTIIGKVKGTRLYMKLENVLIRQRGTGGYVLVDSKWLGKDMRFYMYESEHTLTEIKNMLAKP